jgi:hypothetical protein
MAMDATVGGGSLDGGAAAGLCSTGAAGADGTALPTVFSPAPRSTKKAPPRPSSTTLDNNATSAAADFFFGSPFELESPRCAVVDANGNDAACATGP